jgi:AbrB family looped-hinge helix DNA binding protein
MRITTKGQVTIPREVRERAGLMPGTDVTFEFEAGVVRLVKSAAGGVRTSPPPDFYIGAHAAVSGLSLLTRDARRYAGYLPKVRLISPG